MKKQIATIQEMTKSQAEDFLRSSGFLIPLSPEQIEVFEATFPAEDLPESLIEPIDYPGKDNPFIHMIPQQSTVALAARKGTHPSGESLKQLEEGLKKAKEKKKKS
jgi:hypothetical protein